MRRLALLLVLLPTISRAETKMRVAVLAHAPGISRAGDTSDDVSAALVSGEFAVLSRKRLLEHLVAVAGGDPDPLAEVRSLLARADEQYLDLDLEGADATLKSAEAALSAQLADPEAFAVLRSILERRALVLLTQGRTDPATEKLHQLYVLQPDYRPDPRLLAPQFAPAFEKARAATASASRGTLLVTTAPAGADVYVDGRWIGASPISLDLRAGQHVVQARHAHHAAAGVVVSVDAGARAELPFRLAPLSPEERKKARVREVATNTIPPPRAAVAEEIRALTGASAVVILVARPTGDGPRASAEVHRADQPGYAAKTAELALHGATLAREATKLLDAPARVGGEIAPPQFATRKTVRNPLLLEAHLGPRYFYGTGWGRLSGVAPAAGTIAVGAGFRLEESRSNVVDVLSTIAISSPSGCAPSTDPCTPVTIDTLSVDIAPRLVIPLWRLWWYAQVGVGAVNTTFSIAPPGQRGRQDAVLAVSVHAGTGMSFVVHRRFRIGLETKIAAADAPSPRLEDLTGVGGVNVGGISFDLTIGTRL